MDEGLVSKDEGDGICIKHRKDNVDRMFWTKITRTVRSMYSVVKSREKGARALPRCFMSGICDPNIRLQNYTYDAPVNMIDEFENRKTTTRHITMLMMEVKVAVEAANLIQRWGRAN